MGSIAQYLILVSLLLSLAEGRILSLNPADDELISDGINEGDSTNLVSSCRHQYGFLPCAENAAGYVFLMVVYQVLLIEGDKLIGSGSDVVFYVMGARFGGILFRILRALPSMMLMFVSGISSNKQNAQAQVSVVVGVYAGITVFSLTVQWSMTMLSTSKSLNNEQQRHGGASGSTSWFPTKQKLWILMENGVDVDIGTSRTAKLMLLSLIPYVVLQLVFIFETSSGKRIVTLIALIFSLLSLFLYFAYQIWDPWMQERSLNYTKFDNVQRGLMKQVEGLGKLVNEDGTYNTDPIIRFFNEKDDNGDRCIAVEELEEMVSQVFMAGKEEVDPNEAMTSMLSRFDEDKDKRISMDEFVDAFKQWIDEAKNPPSINTRQMIHNVSRLLKNKKANNSGDIDKVMAKILHQAQGQLMKSELLITENGEPNVERIKCLFREFDTNKDGTLTEAEVKQLVGKVKFGRSQMKDEEVIKGIFRAFDENGNMEIDEEEFTTGIQGYLDKAMAAVSESERPRAVEEFYKSLWEKPEYGKKDAMYSIFRVLLGILMLTFLAGPLMGTILDLSNAMKFPSFVISFVVVPLAMNGRAALAAILSSTRKRKSSSTFSEIYGGVIMNNIAGLTTLLAIVYAKELTWDFSAEVVTIMVVCAIVGTHAFLSKTYHLWTCIPALLLYPFSLGLFYFCQVFLSWN